jgi:hypothetical protein
LQVHANLQVNVQPMAKHTSIKKKTSTNWLTTSPNVIEFTFRDEPEFFC